ncbi:hypothetical protein [Zunongwangia sp.]|uniref:hypothetical protein n=1 Tax=Zunongwangia sp. TaxID=1965325 RepID=UPI003AA9D1F3
MRKIFPLGPIFSLVACKDYDLSEKKAEAEFEMKLQNQFNAIEKLPRTRNCNYDCDYLP